MGGITEFGKIALTMLGLSETPYTWPATGELHLQDNIISIKNIHSGK